MSVVLPKPDIPSHWVLDANILFSEWTRALCMCLAQHQSAQLAWTPVIEHECFRNLIRLNRLHPDDAVVQQATLASRMNAIVLQTDHAAYLADVRCVDEKDRHVAATALQMRHAQQQHVALLTWNLKDFPRKNLLKLGVVRYSPDELAVELIKSGRCGVQDVLEGSLDHLRMLLSTQPCQYPTDYQLKARPLPESMEDWLLFLGRNKMHRLGALLSKGEKS